jgi:hypothetical protein
MKTDKQGDAEAYLRLRPAGESIKLYGLVSEFIIAWARLIS